MDEAMRMRNYDDEDKRIYTIRLEDIKRNDLGKLDVNYYKKYWQDRAGVLFNQIEEQDKTPISKNEELQKNQIYFRIFDFMESFLDEVSDPICLQVNYGDMQKANEEAPVEIIEEKKVVFDGFVEEVIDKMKHSIK